MVTPQGPSFGAFGEDLRRRRKAAGLSLRAVAERIMYDPSYLAQVECGERRGSEQLAFECDTVLNADGNLIELFAQQADEVRTPPTYDEIVWPPVDVR